MNKNLLILGAGADRTNGIDFPMANTLLPQIVQYLDKEGKSVDETLKRMLPNMRFSFRSMISKAIDSLVTREVTELRSVVNKVKQASDGIKDENSIAKKQGMLIVRLFEKLAAIANENQIDEETLQLIKDVFGEKTDEIVNDYDHVIDIHKASLSDTFKNIMKLTLHQSMTTESNPVSDALGMDMLNIEQLLIEKFLGFYNNKSNDIKNYIYISWCLWAFLVHRQKQVILTYKNKKIPFYTTIPKEIKAITLNYTSFLEMQLDSKNIIHFHGGLSEYLRMDTRDLINIDNFRECEPAHFIESDIMPNIDVKSDDPENQNYVIPSLVPPLRLKPILSRKYIDLWYTASQWIKDAEKIVIIGCSLNNADEHFNDILRANKDKQFNIIGPHVHDSYFLKRIEKVLNVPIANFTNSHVQSKNCKKASNVKLIQSNADEVNLSELFNPEMN